MTASRFILHSEVLAAIGVAASTLRERMEATPPHIRRPFINYGRGTGHAARWQWEAGPDDDRLGPAIAWWKAVSAWRTSRSTEASTASAGARATASSSRAARSTPRAPRRSSAAPSKTTSQPAAPASLLKRLQNRRSRTA